MTSKKPLGWLSDANKLLRRADPGVMGGTELAPGQASRYRSRYHGHELPHSFLTIAAVLLPSAAAAAGGFNSNHPEEAYPDNMAPLTSGGA